MNVLLVVLVPMMVTIGADGLQQSSCLREAVRQISITSHSDDESRRVKWETRNCKGQMAITGAVRIAGDLSGFEYIAPNGRVVIASRDRDHERELTLTHAPQGVAYAYEVDGKRSSWDSEGKAWLAAIMELLVRRAGYGAEERVDYLLRTGGVNAVLHDVDVMDSDYIQRVYLTKLLNKTTLNGDALQDVIDVSARTLGSDYELTSFLTAVAAKYNFSPRSRAAFIRATYTLDSDYERKRALTAVLKKGNLGADDAAAVLHSLRSFDSDYERAQVLKAVAAEIDFEQPRLQEAYVKAAMEIDSDYELRQTLLAVLKRDPLPSGAVSAVLASATKLDSDYERAELLMQILKTRALTRQQRSQVITLTDQMSSDYERGRVSSVLVRQMNSQ
jgi:hypothetical protein